VLVHQLVQNSRIQKSYIRASRYRLCEHLRAMRMHRETEFSGRVLFVEEVSSIVQWKVFVIVQPIRMASVLDLPGEDCNVPFG
jgi:hypothetical protein